MAFNLLIVDDSSTIRGIIKKALRQTELPLGELLEAGNGQAGLEMMRAHWVDLVLADLNMPGMNGVEMIAAMGEDPLLAKTPVIVVSSEGNATVLDSLLSQGVKDVVRKPFEPVLLRMVIQKALGVTA